jgi:hypothetical protein
MTKSPKTILSSNFSDVAVPDLVLPPGMISDSERRFLYQLASRLHSGAGEVVEIGTWLGCSTLHLAAGLRDRGSAQLLHSYDDYQWRAGMAAKSGLDLAEGASFYPNFLDNLGPLRPHIDPSVASATDLNWTGGKIETLVIDAPKSWRTIRRVMRQLAPHFISGKTRIALQDYLHLPSYELALYVASVEALVPEIVVMEGSTVVFRVTKAVPAAVLRDDYNYKTFDQARIDMLWGRIIAALPASMRYLLQPAHAMTLWQLGFREAAEAEVAALDVTHAMAQFVDRKVSKKTDAHFAWMRSAVLARRAAQV